MAAVRLSLLFLPLLGCYLSVSAAAEEKLDIYDQAAKCPYRFQMGCMLDVLEKNCGGLQVVEACATKGECKGIDGLERVVGALDPKNFEALNKCCCSKAFSEGGYEDCKNPNPVCKKALADHVDKDLAKHLKLLKKCLKKANKNTCAKALQSAKWVNEAIQKTRGEMRSAEGCQMLAPAEPISACGWEVKPAPRAIERADLYCDTIIWQFKEMGASDHFMATCKDAPAMPPQKEESEEGQQGEEPEEEEGLEEDEEEAKKQKEKKESVSKENASDITNYEEFYSKSSKCKHLKHMGCLLDVVAKSCEATRELSTCINGSSCGTEAIQIFSAATDVESKTFLLGCCCSGKVGYEKCKKPNSKCHKTLLKTISPNMASFSKIVTGYVKKPSKAQAMKALDQVKKIRDVLQEIRGLMMTEENCDKHAPMEPLIQCTWNSDENKIQKDRSTSIERQDIYCDMMKWRYAMLGRFEEDLNECPDLPKLEDEADKKLESAQKKSEL